MLLLSGTLPGTENIKQKVKEIDKEYKILLNKTIGDERGAYGELVGLYRPLLRATGWEKFPGMAIEAATLANVRLIAACIMSQT